MLILMLLAATGGCFRSLGGESSRSDSLAGDGAPSVDGDAPVDSDADGAGDTDIPPVCEPQPETCNGLDDDCDEEIDEDFECRAGEARPCDVCGYEGVQTCGAGCAWTPCDGACPEETPTCCDDGACADTQIDSAHCGDCVTVCGSGFMCEAGMCIDDS